LGPPRARQLKGSERTKRSGVLDDDVRACMEQMTVSKCWDNVPRPAKIDKRFMFL
jgi:hypothetical protein